MVKIYTLFQTKTAEKENPFGAAYTYITYPGDGMWVVLPAYPWLLWVT